MNRRVIRPYNPAKDPLHWMSATLLGALVVLVVLGDVEGAGLLQATEGMVSLASTVLLVHRYTWRYVVFTSASSFLMTLAGLIMFSGAAPFWLVFVVTVHAVLFSISMVLSFLFVSDEVALMRAVERGHLRRKYAESLGWIPPRSEDG